MRKTPLKTTILEILGAGAALILFLIWLHLMEA
jgi:hypothetical protein